MFETTYYTFISLLLYFIILFFSQVLYSILKRKKTSLELLKIIRDLFKTIIFIGVLIYTHILNELSLSVNLVSLFFLDYVLSYLFFYLLIRIIVITLCIQKFQRFFYRLLLKKWFVEKLLIILIIFWFLIYWEPLSLSFSILLLTLRVSFIFYVCRVCSSF